MTEPSSSLTELDVPSLDEARTPRAPINQPRYTPVEAGEEIHILDYVKVLYKRRWLAVSVFSVIVLGTLIYSLTTTPVYQARARLLIEADDPNVVSFKSVIDEQQAKADYYTTQYNILQSRSLARKTLEELKLWDKAPFGGKDQKPSFSLRSLPSQAIGAIAGLFVSKSEGAEAVVDETTTQSAAIDQLLRGLRVTPIRNSRLVDVAYQMPDPAMATQIANSIAANYIEQSLDYKLGASKDASGFLSAQLAEQRKQVEAAELALQRYREQNGAISKDDGENIVVQKLTQLNAEVTKAKTERIQQEAMYRQLSQNSNDIAAIETFPAILSNQFIQQQKSVLADLLRQQAQLSETYGERNERIIKIKSQVEDARAKLNTEIQKVLQGVKTEYQAAVAREAGLVQALNEQKAEALRMNGKAIEYNVLSREVESSRQIYDALMQRSKETGVSGALRSSNIRIVDAAEKPRAPISPNRSLNMLIALFGGGVFAVGLAFFFEYMDNRLKTPDEIRQYLGLSHLGMLPLLPKPEGPEGEEARLLNNAMPTNFLEAFRVIRTNVVFSCTESGGQALLVTSTSPGEGKSIVASNLAISLAQTRKRVLLIDADMRKPKVHTAFGLSQEPGLSNLLVGEVKASAAVSTSSVPGLWVMSAGRTPPNPAELLGSERLTGYLNTFKQHFDWVVIDSPPVMAVADASVVAHETAGVIFVVGAEMTSRHAALRAVQQLESTGAKFLGAVLNKADLERNSYYYSEYYKREYAQYYSAG